MALQERCDGLFQTPILIVPIRSRALFLVIAISAVVIRHRACGGDGDHFTRIAVVPAIGTGIIPVEGPAKAGFTSLRRSADRRLPLRRQACDNPRSLGGGGTLGCDSDTRA